MADAALTGVQSDEGDTSSDQTNQGGDAGQASPDSNSIQQDSLLNQGAVGEGDQGSSSDATNSGETGGEGEGESSDYAAFDLPEGMSIDDTVLADASQIFKDLGLTQDQSQKLVEFHASQVQAESQRQVDSFNQLMNEWQTQTRSDSDIGGDKLEENVGFARVALDKYGTPELSQLMEDHGVGNHLEIIRFMSLVGRSLREDGPAGAASSGSAVSQTNDRVSILYPTGNNA